MPGDQYMEMNGLTVSSDEDEEEEKEEKPAPEIHRELRHAEPREYDSEEHEERRRERREKKDREERKRDRKDRKDREERREKKDRFDSGAIDKFRKKEDKDVDTDDVIELPAAERSLAVPGETHLMVREEPVAEPEEVVEEHIEETAVEPEPVAEPEEEKPKAKARTLRGKRSTSNKTLSPEQEKFRDMLLDLSTTHNAKILGADGQVLREVAVKSLVNSLKEESEGVDSIVFDGVISQRILDVSADKGIKIVVGTRKGNISKMPADIVIWTKEDLY